MFCFLGQVHELNVLYFHEPSGNEVSLEGLIELILVDYGVLRYSLSIMAPPNTSGTPKLMSRVLSLQTLGQPEQMELLFNSVQLLFYLEWFFCLFKKRWLGIEKVLEVVVLIWCASILHVTTPWICHLPEGVS
jgi:hypothetical protein